MRRRAARYLISEDCPACQGKRLKPEALSVTFAGLDIGELSRMPLSDLAAVLQSAVEDRLRNDDTAEYADPGTLDRESGRRDRAQRAASGASAHAGAPDVRATPNLSIEKRLAAQRLAADLIDRIGTLMELGLGYLSLDRVTTTLSSGELQRLRLATQLRSQLFGVAYVLDEPTAGLHPADGDAMHDALAGLLAAGNSLFVVEHDIGTMRRADWLVDVGPAAGEHGGRVLYSGPPEGLRAVEASRTRLHLFGLAEPPRRPQRVPSGWLRLDGIVRNNLRDVSVSFPLGCLTAVTGISGSGKSSLISQALLDLVGDRLGRPIDSRDEPEDPSTMRRVRRRGASSAVWKGFVAW